MLLHKHHHFQAQRPQTLDLRQYMLLNLGAKRVAIFDLGYLEHQPSLEVDAEHDDHGTLIHDDLSHRLADVIAGQVSLPDGSEARTGYADCSLSIVVVIVVVYSNKSRVVLLGWRIDQFGGILGLLSLELQLRRRKGFGRSMTRPKRR